MMRDSVQGPIGDRGRDVKERALDMKAHREARRTSLTRLLDKF